MSVEVFLAPLWRFLESLAPGDFYLQAIAIDEELRSEGVGSMLIDAMEDLARARGSNRLVLDVAGGNDGASKLHERRGMTVETVWPRFSFGRPVFLRMTKPF